MADVIAGIRPEAFSDSALAHDGRAGQLEFTTRIDVVEAMGPEVYAYFDVPCRSELRPICWSTVERRRRVGPKRRRGNVRQMVARLPVASRVRRVRRQRLPSIPAVLNLFDPHTGATTCCRRAGSGRLQERRRSGRCAARAGVPIRGTGGHTRIGTRHDRAVAGRSRRGRAAGRYDEVEARLAELRVVPLATLGARKLQRTSAVPGRRGVFHASRSPSAPRARPEAIGRAREVEGLLGRGRHRAHARAGQRWRLTREQRLQSPRG